MLYNSSMQKDTTLKPIIKKLIKPLSKYFFSVEIDTDNITFIDKELQRVEKREADIVANIDNRYILHIEIQNDYDRYMPQRMLRYYLDISQAIGNKLPIHQYCIYIGKGKNYLKDKIIQQNLDYQYNLIDTRDIDCEYLLNEPSPEAKILAILCDFKQKEPKEVVRYILSELYKTVKDEKELRNLSLALEILSTNRDLQDIVEEEKEMLRTLTLEDLPTGKRIFEKGIEKGFMQSKIEDAIIMVKDFKLDPKVVANKLNISLELLLKEFERYSKC